MKNTKKWNISFLAGISATALAFGLILAGCVGLATGGPAGGGGMAGPAAEQLASDLNAVKGGSAKASGGTVTLSGEIWLETDLTVPAGVTLDLMADGAALGLKDGAVLTVNGTVNAAGHGDHGGGWVDGGLRIDDGATAINGSGTIRLADKGRLLSVWGGNGRKLTLEGVTLVGLADNDQSLVSIGGGSMLVMKSGAITGNTHTDSNISSGGGVEIYEDGAFTMEGGEISGNTAKGSHGANGGGVQVWSGTFTMSGGTISGNAADGGGFSNAGGVNVGENATFTMSGGTVSDNRAEGGGGVAVTRNSTFTMSGGAISGNTAAGSGGGVRIFNGDNKGGGTFTMEGGAISGNTAKYGGGVSVSESTFTLKGGRIQGGEDSDGFTKNTVYGDDGGWWCMALDVYKGTAKWGTGGAYTQGPVSYDPGGDRDGGSNIVTLDDNGSGGVSGTLIAIPAK
ncbi:MAG: hypothetical protein LBQ46_13715 [Treponema sp.]|jgi:hypothetical protein|nr:hypothetical protein [Treponema sp.]